MNNTDRLLKLVTKFGTLNDRISSLQQERDSISAEIQSLTSYDGMNPAKKATLVPTTTKKKGKPGALGAEITAFLQATPTGATLEQISTYLKVKAAKIGLSLYHLTKKGMVYMDKQTSSYFTAVPPMAAPAKQTVQQPMGTYVSE